MPIAANPAQRRYLRRAAVAIGAYALAIVVVVIAFRDLAPQGAIALVLALLPALPIIAILMAIGAYLVEEGDEYLRLVMARRILVATGITLSVATALGFLEAFQQVAVVPAYWIAVLWFAGLGAATMLDRSAA